MIGPNPNFINKYEYIEKTPSWKVKTVYLLGIVAWCIALYGFFPFIFGSKFFFFFFTPLLLVLTIYFFFSSILNLFYKQPDIEKHKKLVEDFWKKQQGRPLPSVDVFLPVCGEDIKMLKNTWGYVKELGYANKKNLRIR